MLSSTPLPPNILKKLAPLAGSARIAIISDDSDALHSAAAEENHVGVWSSSFREGFKTGAAEKKNELRDKLARWEGRKMQIGAGPDLDHAQVTTLCLQNCSYCFKGNDEASYPPLTEP